MTLNGQPEITLLCPSAQTYKGEPDDDESFRRCRGRGLRVRPSSNMNVCENTKFKIVGRAEPDAKRLRHVSSRPQIQHIYADPLLLPACVVVLIASDSEPEPRFGRFIAKQ